MVGVDALTTWLLQRLTESSVRRLRALVFGTELEQALRKISSSALKDTAEQLQAENSEEFILVVAQVFSAPSIETDTSDQELTVLETLISGIRTQVAVLDDRDQTGTGRSAADILGVPGARIANALATNVVDGIRRHALSGGPLLPLSQQLNSDITRLQVKDSHDEIMDALRSLIQDRGRRPRLKRPPGRRNEGSAEATLPKSIEIKIPTKRGIRHTLFAVAVHPNSQWIAVGSSGSATLWDISTGEKISRAFLLGGGCSYSVAFSPDGKLVAVGDQSWGAMVREVPSGRVVVDVHKGQLYENRHWEHLGSPST